MDRELLKHLPTFAKGRFFRFHPSEFELDGARVAADPFQVELGLR